MVRAGLPRPRRPDGPAHVARGADGLGAGRDALPHQPLHRAQGGLGLRGRHHRLHPFVRDLERALPAGPRAHPDDHSREQLHAVHRERGGLLHRRDAHLRLRGLHAHQRPNAIPPGDARVDLLPVGARGDHGHPHEAPDDQHRAAPLPERHRGGRDAPGAPRGRRPRRALGPGPRLGRAGRGRSGSSGRKGSCW